MAVEGAGAQPFAPSAPSGEVAVEGAGAPSAPSAEVAVEGAVAQPPPFVPSAPPAGCALISSPSERALPLSPWAIHHYEDIAPPQPWQPPAQSASPVTTYPPPYAQPPYAQQPSFPPAPQPYPGGDHVAYPMPSPEGAMMAPAPMLYAPVEAPMLSCGNFNRICMNLTAIAMLVCLCLMPDPRSYGVLFIASYVGMLFWSLFASPDAQALRNHMNAAELINHTAAIRAARPTPWAEIVCFHHETRTRTVTRNGKTRTETHTVKVVTHQAREEWQYGIARDVSGPPVYHPNIALLEVHFKPVQDFYDKASFDAYHSWRHSFFARNRRDAGECQAALLAC